MAYDDKRAITTHVMANEIHPSAVYAIGDPEPHGQIAEYHVHWSDHEKSPFDQLQFRTDPKPPGEVSAIVDAAGINGITDAALLAVLIDRQDFPGGDLVLLRWLRDAMHYLQQSREEGWE